MDIINIKPEEVTVTAKLTLTEIEMLLEIIDNSSLDFDYFKEEEVINVRKFKSTFSDQMHNLCDMIKAQYGT
jgi:hypothetical protein